MGHHRRRPREHSGMNTIAQSVDNFTDDKVETRSGTMQVLWQGDGTAHLPPEGASAPVPELSRVYEKQRRRKQHNSPGS